MAKTQQARLIYEQAKNDKNQITANLKLAFLAKKAITYAISNYNHEQNNVIYRKRYDKTLENIEGWLAVDCLSFGNDYLETSTNLSQTYITYLLII